MNKILKNLSILYVFLISFYDVPRTFKGGIALSGIIAVFLWLGWGIEILNGKSKKNIRFPLLLFIPFLIFISFYTFSTLINQLYINDKSVNHVVLYLYTFIIYALTSFMILSKYGTLWFAKIASYSLMVVSLIGFYEISLFYTKGVSAYANFLNHGIGVGFVAGIPRLRSTFNEPSHFALYTICMLPIVLYSKKYKNFLITLLGLLMTLSASAFVALVGASGVSLISFFGKFFQKIKKGKINKKQLVFIIILSIALVYVAILLFDPLYWLYSKVTNPAQMASARYNTWELALSMISNSLFFGYGAASYYNYLQVGIFSWYLQILLEAGIFGLIGLILLLMTTGIFALKSKLDLAKFSVIAFSIQMIGMNHYFIPGFWVLMAFIFARCQEIKIPQYISLKNA